ncbi:YusW family protein [Paenibacillus sp. MMO-58]|uniref:YusW family protein n=1 Tax=Paenibacillus sp. MMO-58 TaxID=3081290 RepID=UPI003015E274
MKKKISYILIGALSTIMLSYGVVAYADYDSSATKEVNRAASDTYVVPSKTAAAAVIKPASAQPSTSEAPIQLEQLKALELKIDGNNVKVKIELDTEEAKTDSKVEIKIGEDQKKYLTGNEATQFIQQLLAVLKLQADMDKQQVMDALFTHFAVEPAKVEMNIDIKWKDRPEELKFKDEKDDDAEFEDDDEAEKDDAKAQTVKSTVQDNQKAQLAANDQSAKQEQKKALIAQKKALQQAWQKAHKEEQEKKKQQKQLNRSDRDHGQNKGQKGDEDEDDQGEGHDHDGDHGKHQEHEEHDDED